MKNGSAETRNFLILAVSTCFLTRIKKKFYNTSNKKKEKRGTNINLFSSNKYYVYLNCNAVKCFLVQVHLEILLIHLLEKRRSCKYSLYFQWQWNKVICFLCKDINRYWSMNQSHIISICNNQGLKQAFQKYWWKMDLKFI